MLNHWNKLLATECVVIGVGDHVVYPIFRVGYTTLMSVRDRQYVDEHIRQLKHIDIIIRDPEQRFISGVNRYCRENKLDLQESWSMIKKGKLIDRHFAPQYIWLLHLSKFYKGNVTLRPLEYIKKITKTHENRSANKIDIPLIEEFTKIDKLLLKHQNNTVALESIIRKYKNVLS